MGRAGRPAAVALCQSHESLLHSRENPELGLRVVTDPSRKLDYFPGVVKEMAERLKHPQEGLPATIIEATALKVQGLSRWPS